MNRHMPNLCEMVTSHPLPHISTPWDSKYKNRQIAIRDYHSCLMLSIIMRPNVP